VKRLYVLIKLFVLVCALLPAEQRSAFIQTSHLGGVTDLVYDFDRQLLFSAGEDGTVRVWNPADKELLTTIRISNRPVQRIAVHPTQYHITAVVGEGIEADTLIGWDWKRQRRIFMIESDTQLLHLSYSPQGKYLFYTKADFRSVTAVNPKTGRVLPYMGRGFGIVSYFTVSRNETNIMTYGPSGTITYRDIRTGNTLKQVKTSPNLSHIRISPNNRFIAASTGEYLTLVDVLSGETVDRTRAEGIRDLSFTSAGNEILGVVETESGMALKKWYFGGRYIIEISLPQENNFPGLSRVACGDRDIYLVDEEATIWSLSPGAEEEILATDLRMKISDLAFQGSALAVASSDEIRVFDSDFFLGRDDESEQMDVEELRFTNPFSAPAGVEYLDNQRLLVWNKSEEEGGIAVLNTWYGGIRQLPIFFESPIKQLTVSPDGIVMVEKGGLCRVLDLDTYATEFEYHAPGMNKLIFTFSDTLVGASTSLSAFAGPLLQINRRTGETVPVQDSSLFVYDIIYAGERNGVLYTLAVEQQRNRTSTVLKAHSGYNFERAKILVEFAGEDLGATLVADEQRSIYTSLGSQSVRVFSNGIESILEDSGEVPRHLYVHSGRLFSLNRDFSISVWEIRSRRFQFNIHFFRDGSWTALTADGRVRTSEDERRERR